jgi:hypothetical protein
MNRKTLIGGKLIAEDAADKLRTACLGAGVRPTRGTMAFLNALQNSFKDPVGPLAEAHGIDRDVAEKLAEAVRPKPPPESKDDAKLRELKARIRKLRERNERFARK